MYSLKVCDVKIHLLHITKYFKVQLIVTEYLIILCWHLKDAWTSAVIVSVKLWVHLTNVNPMEVIGSKGCVALGAFPLPGVVASFDALEAEDMKALGQHSVLHSGVAARTC